MLEKENDIKINKSSIVSLHINNEQVALEIKFTIPLTQTPPKMKYLDISLTKICVRPI